MRSEGSLVWLHNNNDVNQQPRNSPILLLQRSHRASRSLRKNYLLWTKLRQPLFYLGAIETTGVLCVIIILSRISGSRVLQTYSKNPCPATSSITPGQHAPIVIHTASSCSCRSYQQTMLVMFHRVGCQLLLVFSRKTANVLYYFSFFEYINPNHLHTESNTNPSTTATVVLMLTTLILGI